MNGEPEFQGGVAMRISRDDVVKVGQLARLQLNDEEVSTFTSQMDAILAYVDKLNELDTDHIIPTAHAVPLENAFRDDVMRPSLGADHALAAAPDRADDFFRVPKVIE